MIRMIHTNRGKLFLLTLLLSLQGFAQKPYEANWKSIDSRPVPEWYTDAKFGIFIHWGPYSVPAFSKVGEYSEWYWMNLANPQRVKNGYKETNEFHNRVYGENFTYPDFVPLFTADMYDADQWARIFEKSGAKYVVLTSKHHDGYTLWPSKESDKSWGRPWSATNSGPGRDLLGELTTAVRKTDVKMGIYYSLYEWFNPLYTSDVDLYVDQHMVPQFKDVVNKYSPSLIFTDGEWDYPHTTWKATELLSWLYNESPSKEDVVINDRWGKETRHHHGGYYTTEYGSGMPNADVPWEENRGMAHSFGFSKTENFEDYNSTQELLYMLIDIVSRGGNFLLDIGPTADGRIPVIMQERLLEMGDWLNVNGEAIYGTTLWKETCQWTDGQVQDAKRGRYKVKYDVMKLTVDPEPGFASKEIFFTQKGQTLYGICPVYPKGNLTVKNVKLKSDAKVTLLGYEGPLKWEQNGKDIIVNVPSLTASEVPCDYAWTFKIDGVKK
ncbi:alpha-L-fucosidase [Zobellia sp. OII3]|uniref:alpha-L-fucosidase n=1 Tax=Zobellia sp. OII3 TaxID=2034520 RepID=UPI000B531B5D|nr:alpha-L-fucosidase [Zobellia sp. OII3]OWW24589.1 alpha-L-fucosidase [Zobellia sp. OII3]